MVQPVKHEDLSLDPEHPCEELVPTMGSRDRRGQEGPMGSLVSWSSQAVGSRVSGRLSWLGLVPT